MARRVVLWTALLALLAGCSGPDNYARPTVGLTVTPTRLSFQGGDVSIQATGSTHDPLPVTTTCVLTDPDGSESPVALAAARASATMAGTVTLPANYTFEDQSYTVTASTTDGWRVVDGTQTVVVEAMPLPVAGDVDDLPTPEF